jgi:hypothetical protein
LIALHIDSERPGVGNRFFQLFATFPPEIFNPYVERPKGHDLIGTAYFTESLNYIVSSKLTGGNYDSAPYKIYAKVVWVRVLKTSATSCFYFIPRTIDSF